MKSTFIILFSLLVFFKCKENDVAPDDLEVTTQDAVLKIHNRLKSRVYYFVVESETAQLINWAPTVDENSPFIESKKSVEISYENISGYEDGAKEAIVYHWKAIDKNGSLVPGDILSVIVSL